MRAIVQDAKVLIIGASGGVGSYAVQLARAFGAKVTGEASSAKAGLVRSIGADEVIDYTREGFADGRQHYDLILDIGGNSRLSRLRRALSPQRDARNRGQRRRQVDRSRAADQSADALAAGPPAADHLHLCAPPG